MIPRLLVDTSAYTALLAGHEGIADLISDSEAVLLSTVVIGELLDGFLGSTREEQNRHELKQMRAKSRTVVVPVTGDTAEWFATVKQQLRRKGTPIPINDVWIAASALEHGATLVSRDHHFENVDGLLRRLVRS